ncbi:MAG: PilZ domain-containing protein [Planctomycetota bacterium]|jgi:c-di-GMP-binding flagellar brake protein YcgR
MEGYRSYEETGRTHMASGKEDPSLQVGERRRYHRYAETNRVLFVEVAHAAKTYEGVLRDLSAGGLCLTTSREVTVGTRLCLGIFFEHKQDNPLIVIARVRRCSPEEDGFVLGLEFLRTTNAQRRALRHVSRYLVERHGG